MYPTMEYYNDKPQRKSRSHTKSQRDKSPTRLQKRAPKSLHLDVIVSANPFQPSVASREIIPLLSPLILTPPPSPSPSPATPAKEAIHQQQSNEKDDVQPGAWQHPAVVEPPEPSSLYNVFPSQCVLINSL